MNRMRLIDADELIAKCGIWYVEEGTEEGFISDLKHLLDLQPTVPHWIPVTERLPERCNYYIVTDFNKVDEAYYNSDGRWFSWDGNKLKDVTAWMPLPEPPEMFDAIKEKMLSPKMLTEYPNTEFILKDKAFVDFLNLPPQHNEHHLHRGLLEHMKEFILT